MLAKCSENIHAENITVKFSIGMAIGSVPPHSDYNCVNNVTFKNIDFDFPLKAIYVKTKFTYLLFFFFIKVWHFF